MVMGIAGDELDGVVLAVAIANTALPLLVNTAPCSAVVEFESMVYVASSM